jgi:polyhydroxybutyrate depolymerase
MPRPAIKPLVILLVVLAACGGGGARTSSETTATSSRAQASPACAVTGSRPSLDRLGVTVAGTARTSSVHLPEGWDGTEAIPVVLSFHGAGQSGVSQQPVDGLIAKADQERFAVLYPDGAVVDLQEIHGVTGWDLTGEPAFVTALLDALGDRVCIDPSRVFATGFSNGAEMAMAVACALPDRIAAFASVAAGRRPTCGRRHPVAALAFHGTDDIFVPYRGNAHLGLQPIEGLMGEQAKRNGCTGGPEPARVTATVETLTWTGCDARTVLYRLADHGHAWPGRPLPLPREALTVLWRDSPVTTAMGTSPEEMADNNLLTNTDINATDLMWGFFAGTKPTRR